MKEKILYLVLGILIGAVITAGCFLVLKKNSKPDFKPGDFDGKFDKEMMQDFDPENFDPEKFERRKGDKEKSDSNSASTETSTDTQTITE